MADNKKKMVVQMTEMKVQMETVCVVSCAIPIARVPQPTRAVMAIIAQILRIVLVRLVWTVSLLRVSLTRGRFYSGIGEDG